MFVVILCSKEKAFLHPFFSVKSNYFFKRYENNPHVKNGELISLLYGINFSSLSTSSCFGLHSLYKISLKYDKLVGYC